MKVVSYSLYGDIPKYTIGAIRNAELCKIYYPDWKCIFFIGNTVPIEIKNKLESFDNVIIIEKYDNGGRSGSFWRFDVINFPSVEVAIFRDVDSRPNRRESLAVEEWLKSDKIVHSMHDHPGQNSREIYAGLWGIKLPFLKNFTELLNSWKARNNYGDDEDFLTEKIYPLVKNNIFIHDSIYNTGKDFPIEREDLTFMGEPFDENENVIYPFYREQLKEKLLSITNINNMAHKQQIEFCRKIQSLHTEHFTNKKVLDIGSLDINGNNRYLFTNCVYLGVDIEFGKNVDLKCKSHELNFSSNYFDTIISTETFEHDPTYYLSLNNIIRMLNTNGMFIFTCATIGRPEHGTERTTPADSPFTVKDSLWKNYYKNLTEKDIRDCLDIDNIFKEYSFELGLETSDLYFYGIKK